MTASPALHRLSAALADVTLASLHHNACLGRDLYTARRDVSAEVDIYRFVVSEDVIEAASRIVVESPINQRKEAIPAVYYEETCAYLRSTVAAMRDALAIDQNREAYERGFEDFPAGRYMDALRGAKPYPSYPRCPFRIPAKVKAWEAGFNDAHSAVSKPGEA